MTTAMIELTMLSLFVATIKFGVLAGLALTFFKMIGKRVNLMITSAMSF